MNNQLKAKRDAGAKIKYPKPTPFQNNSGMSSPNAVSIESQKAFEQGYDQAIRDVIELLGEYNEEEFKEYMNELQPVGFRRGARWQHAEILKKLR